MLAPLSPFEAYRTDLDRLRLQSEIGESDTVWLLLAHCLGRLSYAGDYVREQLATTSAEALRDLCETTPARNETTTNPTDFERLIAGLQAISTPSGADVLSRAVRGYALRMSEAGALSVAYAVLANARVAVAQASDRERGLLAADQARDARLLGELESADELYRVAGLIGERANDEELLARCALGRGVLARIRGNYPRARHFFGTGLAMARSAGALELEYYSHQGMTIVCGVTHDFDAGIRHGWCAYALGAGDGTRESESLTNLAQLCLDAGYAGAALRAFLGALSRTTVLRVRLPGLGGAALAAGRVQDAQRLVRLRDEIDRTIERSALPYENADALRSLSAAFLALGDQVNSERYRQATLRISREHGFHELTIRAERAEVARTAKREEESPLGEASRKVVVDLEHFEPEADETAFALTRSG
jgi:tetratricopeptide (TPR) repeat protein